MFEINKIPCHKGGGWNPLRVEEDSVIGTKDFFNTFDFLSFLRGDWFWYWCMNVVNPDLKFINADFFYPTYI